MAYLSGTQSVATRTGFIRRLAARIVDTLDWFGNIHGMMAAAERLARMSDAELQARGTSRPAEIQRIFDARAPL